VLVPKQRAFYSAQLVTRGEKQEPIHFFEETSPYHTNASAFLLHRFIFVHKVSQFTVKGSIRNTEANRSVFGNITKHKLACSLRYFNAQASLNFVMVINA